MKRYNSWTLTEEEKSSPNIIFDKFLELKENNRLNHLKLKSYREKAEESQDNFVNRCRRQAQRRSLPEIERQERIIELIITSISIADFQKRRLKKDDTLTRKKTLHLDKTYEASSDHIKQPRSMQNTTCEATNFVMQAIGPLTRHWKAKKSPNKNVAKSCTQP